jgi:hypothetical protein
VRLLFVCGKLPAIRAIICCGLFCSSGSSQVPPLCDFATILTLTEPDVKFWVTIILLRLDDLWCHSFWTPGVCPSPPLYALPPFLDILSPAVLSSHLRDPILDESFWHFYVSVLAHKRKENVTSEEERKGVSKHLPFPRPSPCKPAATARVLTQWMSRFRAHSLLPYPYTCHSGPSVLSGSKKILLSRTFFWALEVDSECVEGSWKKAHFSNSTSCGFPRYV